jgi:hypothetical protein
MPANGLKGKKNKGQFTNHNGKTNRAAKNIYNSYQPNKPNIMKSIKIYKST